MVTRIKTQTSKARWKAETTVALQWKLEAQGCVPRNLCRYQGQMSVRAKSAHAHFSRIGTTRILQFGGFSVWHPDRGNASRQVQKLFGAKYMKPNTKAGRS